MKIIISPAKKMRDDIVYLKANTLPQYLDKTKILLSYLQSLSFDQLKQVFAASDAITRQNAQRYQQMQLDEADTPAILAYDGIAFQYMAPQVFNDDEFVYVNDHVRIISGFYGILRPFDAVVPYRLEMQAKLVESKWNSLYEFWKDDLYEALNDDVILNLASSEYSKCIIPYCKQTDRIITCVFGELVDGKVKEKGVYVKMARGEMVRYLAENKITSLEGVKSFDRLGYVYDDELSGDDKFVFIGSPKAIKK